MIADSRIGVRIGMVNYINTAPIHEVWKAREHDPDWQLVEAHPAALNRMLAEAELEMGFVSSHEYGVRPRNYRLLADLSISANGPVGSVFLFSRVKPEMLSGMKVLLSSQSKTSVCLVQIILSQFFNVTPEYIGADIKDARKLGAEAILAIGDDALRLKIDGSYQYCLDLGEAWQTHTGLPFVFGVCAVREEFLELYPRLVAEIHRELLSCRDEGLASLKRICSLAAPKIPMEVAACHSYLQAIEFDLDEKKRRALDTFFTYLVPMGEASIDALPLKIIPRC